MNSRDHLEHDHLEKEKRMLRYPALVAASLFYSLFTLSAAHAATGIDAAIADPARPEADKKQDASRTPAEGLAFIDIKPGGGYYTRPFSKLAGADGRVYAVVPEELFKMKPDADAAVQAIAADPAYPNVKVLKVPVAKLSAPEPLDVVWTSMNYHDLSLKFFGSADVAAVNKGIFDALKPGGVYIVLDHAAKKGSGLRDADTLHRIDPEAVKKEVTAAGFVLDAESDVLRN